MAEFASNAKGNWGAVTGTIGTAGFGVYVLDKLAKWAERGGRECVENNAVNRYELGLQMDIAAKESKINHLESTIYTDAKITDVYKELNAKIGVLETQANQQAVYNATNTATLNCMGGQIAQLMALTRLTIPNSSICPGWGNVTVTPSTTTTGA